jgi:Predicted membrane protein (DUF2142)
VSFALLFVMGASWAVASPLLSGSDEGAHAIKAAAVVRGELRGANTGPRGRPWLVHVPAPFAQAQVPFTLCYLYRTGTAGSCGFSVDGPPSIVQVNTQFGGYPPLYYLAVGLPSLAAPSALGLYLMRLVSVAITSAFLASALVSAFSWRRSRMLVLGTGVAIVPTVIYVGAVINDSGLEISPAICLWVSLLVFVLDPPPDGGRRLLARAGVSAGALVLARPLSPLWLVVIVCTVLALVNRQRLAAVVRRRDVQAWAAAVAVCAGLAVVWTTSVGVAVVGRPCPSRCTSPFVTGYVLSHTDTYVRQMTGLFSYNNVAAPLFTFVLWWTLVAALVVVALVVGRRRQALVLVGLAAATIFLPVAIQLVESSNYGILWQGRYSLPLAAGIPLLAAFIIGRRSPGLERRHRWLATTAIVAIAVGHAGAFIWCLRHFMWGQGQWSFLHSQWEPPVPGIVLVIAFVAVTSAYAWWLRAQFAVSVAPAAPSIAGGRGGSAGGDRQSGSQPG